MTAFQRFFNVSFWLYVENNWKKIIYQCFFQPHANLVCNVIWSNWEHLYQTFSFLAQSDANKLLAWFCNHSFFSMWQAFTSSFEYVSVFYNQIHYDKKAVVFFSKNSEEVIIFHQLTNQNSTESTIDDTKFQQTCKPTSANYLLQFTTFQRLFNVSLWVYVGNSWKKVIFQCCFLPPREFRYANLFGRCQRAGIKDQFS